MTDGDVSDGDVSDGDPSGDAAAARWQRVGELMDAALACGDAAERARLLDAACADDPALRREVESLLAAHASPGALDRMEADVAPLAARLRTLAAPALEGRTIGRYRVLERIAGGSMGAVYRGMDEGLGRAVALKFLHPRFVAEPAAIERFRREARAIAALEHPNVCTVHEIGETDDGQLFLVMPLYEGATLQQRIARGPLAVDEAVDLAVQVARGLGRAHARGIVHRDIKPSNVFVTSDGVVKILDFGIAKFGGVTITATADGPLGTVAYMSPEQLGEDPVDARADLWALGVVLHEMLTGRRPFAGERPAAVIAGILHDTPAPPSVLRAGVPPALDGIVARALAKSPLERHASAGEMERELLAVDRAGVSSGTGVAPAGPVRRHARTPWLAGAAAAAVLLLALGGVAAARRAGRATAAPSSDSTAAAAAPEPSIVVLPFVDLRPDSARDDFGDGLTEEVITRLGAVPELKVISRTSAMHYKGSTAPLRQIAAELGVAHVLEGSVRRDGARFRVTAQLVEARTDVHRWAHSFDVGRGDVLDVQDDIAQQVVAALRLTLQEEGRRGLVRRGTEDPEAADLVRRGRFHWERRNPVDHAKAVADFERAIARDSGYADAWAGLADAYLLSYQGWWSTLPESVLYARHRAAAERAVALDDGSAAAHTSLATSFIWRKDWRGTEREFRRAIALEPGNVAAHYWYGLQLGGEGRLDEAVQETRIASQLDPFAVISVLNYGWACSLARDFGCAIEQYRRGIELTTTGWERAHAALGLYYAYTGRLDEAQREVETAIRLNPKIGAYQADLANVHARAGRPAEARRALARAVAQRAFPLSVARAYAAMGQPDSAFAWLERVEWRWPFNSRWDPGLDPVRNDPRFAQLSARVDREMGMR